MAQPSQSPNSDVTSVDGSVDFSGGVDSNKVPTITSQANPNGLQRNQLGWLINGTVRDGGITPRGGWNLLKRVTSGSFRYQGGFMYQPTDGSSPYLILLIGGRVYKCPVDTPEVTDLFSTAYQITPSDIPSIVLKNLSLTPGDTIQVPADVQSVYGLPPSFVAPAVGASSVFPLSGPINGQVNDVVYFYGAFTITALGPSTFNSALPGWSFTATLRNDSFPPGKTVTTTIAPFGNPHGIPAFGKLTGQFSGMNFTSFVAPPIGTTVNVNMTMQFAQGLGNSVVLFEHNGGGIIVAGVGKTSINGVLQTDQFSYNAGTHELTDSVFINFAFDQANLAALIGQTPGQLCGENVITSTNSPASQFQIGAAIRHLDCTNVFVWTVKSVAIDPQVPLTGFVSVVLTQSNPDPHGGLTVGEVINSVYASGLVTNINFNTFGRFGTDRPYFCQGNEFLVIQAGDYTTLPLFWNGTVLRKSIGINNNAVAPGTPGVNEIPAGGPMDFYMGRLWYAQGNTFSAGDITGGASGTAAYNFRDAILDVTENPLVLGGDGFSTPSNEGQITALNHNANQDSALGQGRLIAFTGKGAHALSVPVTRADWIAANNQNQPLLVPVQLANGTLSDRSVVPVNGDLFYQSPQADIRTLLTAVRYFNQWGNIPISANENRVTQFVNASLLNFATAIYFDNRMIQSTLPINTPQGVVHQAYMPLDFESISQYGENLDPTWEGMAEGIDILQLFTGTFSGKERAFAMVVSRITQDIQLWEITVEDRLDNVDNRIQMITEFPAFTWGNEFSLKKLVSAEVWIDRLFGEVVFTMEYRPDGESCWLPWHKWKVCSPRNSCENLAPDPCTGLTNAICYPLTTFGESYRQTMTLPTPPNSCERPSGRPGYIGYQFQPRLIVHGFCRVRGLLLHAEPVEKKLWTAKVC